VRELAEAVSSVIPGVSVSINKDAQPDKRSYKVNFDLFKKLAPDHQPTMSLVDSVKELKNGFDSMGFKDGEFRDSRFMRLKALTDLQDRGLLDQRLRWIRS
jgi:hypothetical protein